MATFKWKDAITVTVGEMSRTQALECAREFDMLTKVYTDYVNLMREADAVTVVHAPTIVKIKDVPFTFGRQTIEVEGGDSFDLTLPLTREGFYSLPMSLTEAWISAAVNENGWFIETLKKVFSLTSPKTSDSESGNAQSEKPSQPTLTTTTIGE